MNILCKLLIVGCFIAYWRNESKRKKRDLAKEPGLMALAAPRPHHSTT